ncbi:MAG: DUF5665 domain-containing protein [Microgenomates group bacterium]|jgi:hypothetical protein
MTPQVKRHLTANSDMKRKDIMLGNFLGGMAWGIGTVIGASVVVGAVGYMFNRLGVLNVFTAIFGN